MIALPRYILLLRTWKDLKDAKETEENHPESSTVLTKQATSRPHNQILLMMEHLLMAGNTENTVSKSLSPSSNMMEIEIPDETKM